MTITPQYVTTYPLMHLRSLPTHPFASTCFVTLVHFIKRAFHRRFENDPSLETFHLFISRLTCHPVTRQTQACDLSFHLSTHVTAL